MNVHVQAVLRGAIAALVLAGGCEGVITSPARPDAPPVVCAESDTDAMRLALAPTCESCHGAGASRPFFESLVAFEDLLVYEPRYVVRGDPDASLLVDLLEGTASGPYAQMPLAGDSFAVRAARGETGVSVEEVRAWIRDLPPPDRAGSGPDPSAPSIRRLSVDEAINALEVALGQEPHGGVPPLLTVSGTAPLAPDSPTGVDSWDSGRREVYLMLGGANYLKQRMPEAEWSPSSLIAWTQTAQGACVSAVDAPREVLFPLVSPSATLPDAEPDVRANIAYLYERFLHEAPTEAETDALFEQVFVPAAEARPRDGWVQVCAALARDPLFITF